MMFSFTGWVSFCLKQKMSWLCVLVMTLALVERPEFVRSETIGLYETTEDVYILSSKNFQDDVVKSKPDVFWVVEFYNSWCGHCIRFAPTWKKVATALKDWKKLVVISAIDCSDSSNTEICRAFDVNAFPTMKIFPPVDEPKRLDNVETISSREELPIKGAILNFMTKYAPKSWPRLQPLEKIEDIWEEKKDSHEYVLLLFEEEGSPVGRQVILDTMDINNVLVRRMLKDVVTKFGINKFPSLYKVNPDSTYSMLAVGNKMDAEDRTLYVNMIKALARGEETRLGFAQNKKVKPGDDTAEKKPSETDGDSLQFKPTYNISTVSMQDLESAIHYSFRQEIAICKVIDGDKMSSLKKFLEVLMKYFPGRKPVEGFLSKVHEMLAGLSTDSVTGEEWMDRLDSVQNKDHFLPEVIKWECCQGSSPGYRGYPCSMWTLFHVLTVSAYNHKSSARPGNPQEVLLAIRGYMEHFFGCHECSKNFLAMAATIPDEVKEPKDSVIWLWSAHNKANKRLHGDASEDPKHPKIQFPSKQMCPKCQILKKSEENEGMSFSWDKDKVLEFLVNYYSEKSLRFPEDLLNADQVLNAVAGDGVQDIAVQHGERDWWEKKQREQDLKQVQFLRAKKREKMKVRQERELVQGSDGDSYVQFYDTENAPKSVVQRGQFVQMWGLNHMDISMCVVFYLVSTVIILMLYHYFIVKRRMSPCKTLKISS